MADGKFEIKVDIISDPNGKAKVKSAIGDLEREVLASQKRIQAGSKATDRAIEASQKAVSSSASRQAKQQANEIIRELNRTESAAKKTSFSIQGYMNSAFGGGLIGGAIGGLAGSIVASFSAGVAQLPSIMKTQVDEMIRIATERQNAFKGLQTMSQFLGISDKDSQNAVRNLRLVRSGVVEISDATIAMKNLLSSGFSLPEATKLIEAFSDTAAFGKSAALGFGEAIRGATEGIRNGNSILVDNVGLTKNLSIILKEAGFAEKDLMNVKDDMNVRQALFNGLLKEAIPQMGDADRLTKGWTGSTAALVTAKNNLYAAIGDVIINNRELLALVKTLTSDINTQTTAVQNAETGWKKSISNMTSTFAEFVNSVNLGIRKEIADLQELVNLIETAAYGLAALGSDLGMGWTEKGAERLREYQSRKAKIGTFYSGAEQYERNYLQDYNRNRVIQMGLTPGYNPLLGKPLGNFRDSLKATPSTAFSGYSINPDGTITAKTSASPSVLNAGGGSGSRPRSMPKTKSSKVNLNLKDDMSDALDIAARFGLVVTSGKDGKHNEGSAHLTGGAFDIRTTGVSPNVIGAAMQAFREAGYNVKDERVRPPGQKEWSAPHFHVSGAGRRKGAGRADREIASYISDFPGMLGGSYGKGTARFGSPIELDAAGNIVSYGDLGKGRGERAEISRDIDLSKMEKQLAIGEQQVEVYKDLYRALAELNDMSKEEEFWLDVKLGKYKEFTDEQLKEIANTYALIDAKEKKNKVDEDNQRALEDYQREQQRLFEDTRQGWEDLLNDLANGNFKSIWDRFRQQMLDAFIKPASAYLAQLFGGMGMPGGQQGGSGGLGGIFSGIFGGGSIGPMNAGGMGPGGTPMFNPSAGGGGFGGILGNLFGGGQGGGGFNLGGLLSPRGGGSGSTYIPGIGGGITIPGGMGSGGFGGFLRGIGGGSMMGGVAGLGAMGASIAGGAIGGKWGNMLSLAGTGAMIGLQFGGPWGAAIGGAIGAGAGLIAMLFGGDKTAKRIKEAALSTYGITIKDKSVLKSLVQLGKSMFGKGAAENAQAVVSSDEGQLILRNYAEATNQSSEKIDKLYIGDENWKGNQFTSKFGGFRAFGGPVSAGKSYVVGERGPEVFKPSTSGTIVPNTGGGFNDADRAIMGGLAEALYMFVEKFSPINEGALVARGLEQNPDAAARAWERNMATSLRAGEQSLRLQGVFS